MSRLRIGLSACLLGQRVRYDGRLKGLAQIVDGLANLVCLVPVCPEVECGLPVPREAIQLEDDPQKPQLRTVDSHLDLTERMQQWSAARLSLLEQAQLDAYLFKSKSPSCGLGTTPVFSSGGEVLALGDGLYAAALRRRFPRLIVEDELALADARRWKNFVDALIQAWVARGGPGDQAAFNVDSGVLDQVDGMRQALLSLGRSTTT